MWRELLNYGLIAVFVALWSIAAVSWGFAVYYMFKALARFRPDRTWGKFVPISMFMPSFFTDEGNVYRGKLLRASAVFLACVGAGIGIGLVSEVVREDMSSNLSVKRDAALTRVAPYFER